MRGRMWLGALLAGVVGCGGGDAEPGEGEATPVDSPEAAGGATAESDSLLATATLRDTAGTEVGTARFGRIAEGVFVEVDVRGLPAGTHGIHIHEVGRCEASTDTAFSSAGGHLNPAGREHGLENPAGSHGGDMPNLEVGADGSGQRSSPVLLAQRGVQDGAAALLDADGAALIVHANADDQRTNDGPQGPGNSGARIACGVITR